jgi:hypothetical protein
MSSNVISVVSAKLKGDRQAVTAKWVSTTQNVSADEAKRALEAVYSANNDSVGVIYMVTGIAANMAVKVQLVSAANLDAHCSKLTRVVSKTVYALYPATEATPSPDAEKAALYNAWSLSNVEQRAMYLSGDIMAANSLRTNSSSAITNTSVTRSRGAFALPTVSAPPVVSVSNAFDAVSGSSVLASARRQPSIASAFSKGTSPAAAVASPAATGSAPLAKSTSAGIKGMFAAAAAATPAVASPAPVAAAASSPVKKALSWGSDSSSTTPPASGGFGFSLGDDPFGDTPVLTKRKGAAVAARKPAGGARGRKGGAKTEGMSDFVAADGEESGSGGDNSAGEEEEDEETFVRRTTEVVAAARRAATALDDDDEDDYDERKIRAAKQAEMRRAAIAAHDESDSDDDAAAVAATTAASVTDKGGRKKSSKVRTASSSFKAALILSAHFFSAVVLILSLFFILFLWSVRGGRRGAAAVGGRGGARAQGARRRVSRRAREAQPGALCGHRCRRRWRGREAAQVGRPRGDAHRRGRLRGDGV